MTRAVDASRSGTPGSCRLWSMTLTYGLAGAGSARSLAVARVGHQGDVAGRLTGRDGRGQ
ncbi:hypothetical protein [Baekduia alba]|uniref:hypothetical protein n=1 Tax=Baekduia alba TaxID=2997333 RepID=UPI00233F81D5|nr:hypothetical protein [Baekduia alba]